MRFLIECIRFGLLVMTDSLAQKNLFSFLFFSLILYYIR